MSRQSGSSVRFRLSFKNGAPWRNLSRFLHRSIGERNTFSAEAGIWSVLDALGDCICGLDVAGRILFANAAMRRKFRDSSGSLKDRAFVDLISPGARDAARQALHHTDVTRESQTWQEEPGSASVEVWREWTIQPLSEPESALRAGAAMLVVGRDITEQKRLEQQFLHAQRVGSIGMLASGIAHDLNNVLAPIVMSIDLLKMRGGSEENRTLLDVVSTSAGRGASLVSQMLSFSRGLDGRRENVDVTALVKELARFIGRTFAKNICVRTDVAAGLRPVHANPTQIYQALLNLCVNARDAMPRGGDLTIAASNVVLDAATAAKIPGAFPGDFLMLGVSDTGSGIPPEMVNHIFEPFFTTKPVGEGTGLGLSTVRSVVRSVGGFVTLSTRVGAGTIFHLYLPVKDVVAEEVEATAGPAAGQDVRGSGEHVLVVDDEEFFREVTRRLLEGFGYVAHMAADGAEALKVFRELRDRVDVVMVDLNMPVKDGRSTIRELKAINPDVRIITVSGSEEVLRPGDCSADVQLIKPYSMSTLLDCLRLVLSQNRCGPVAGTATGR